MNAVAQIFALVAGLFHVGVFVLKLLIRQPRFAAFFLVRPEHVPVVRLWARTRASTTCSWRRARSAA